MRTHGYHWFDLARMQRQPHRADSPRALLYNIFDTAPRARDAMEELMMQAGLCDTRRGRGARLHPARAESGPRHRRFRMHANQWSIEQAARFASATPPGWLRWTARPSGSSSTCISNNPGTGRATCWEARVDQLIARGNVRSAAISRCGDS